MMQIIGWADLGIDLVEGDSGSDLNDLAATTQSLAEEFNLSRAIDVAGVGGSYILRMTLVQNRDNGDTERCLQLLSRLAEIGPASYGVFFQLDDDVSDSFQRIILRRGMVEVQQDDLLSPVIPMIENAE